MLHLSLLALGGLMHILWGSLALPGEAASVAPVGIEPPAGVGS